MGLEGFDGAFGAAGMVEGLDIVRYRNDSRVEDVVTCIPLCRSRTEGTNVVQEGHQPQCLSDKGESLC